MKTSFLLFLIFCMVSGVTCSSAYSQTALNIGTDDFPPYEFTENEKITGLCTEVVENVLQRMNVSVSKLKIYPWKRGVEYLSQGTIDALYTAGRDKEREDMFHYPSEELIITKWVLFIKKKDVGRIKFDSLEDLLGKRIGVIRGYSYTPGFWDFLKQNLNYEEVAREEQNFKKLYAGRLDLIVSEFGVGMFIVKKLGLTDQITVLKSKSIKTEPQYVIFSKKTVTEEFARKFSDELKAFKSTPQYEFIIGKYLEQ